jgi:hypothetical protein
VQPSGHRLSVVSPRRHVGFFRRVFRGHVWFQAVAASPLRVSDEGVVVEDAAQSSKRSSATGWITSSPERPPGRMARSVAGSPRRSCGSPDRGCGHSWLLRACARNRSPRSVRSSASTVAPHSKQSRCMSLAPVQADPRPFVEANRRVVTPACSERARLDHRVRPRALTMTCPGEVAASDSARRAQRGTASAVGAPRALATGRSIVVAEAVRRPGARSSPTSRSARSIAVPTVKSPSAASGAPFSRAGGACT